MGRKARAPLPCFVNFLASEHEPLAVEADGLSADHDLVAVRLGLGVLVPGEGEDGVVVVAGPDRREPADLVTLARAGAGAREGGVDSRCILHVTI